MRQVGADPLTGEAGFSYTVGSTAVQHPEVVVTGMPAEHALDFLDLIGEDVRGGRRFEDGSVTDELRTPGSPVVFIRAEQVANPTADDRVYGRVDALLKVWRDSTGRLPWEHGYRNTPDVQPLLGPTAHVR